MMQTQIRSVAQFLTSSGPLTPTRRESDDRTPTMINLLIILGLVVAVLGEAGSELSKAGLAIVLFSATAKFAFNYATSDERRFWGRMRHALWTLLYHPTTGRPFRVLDELRRYEGVASLIVAVMAAVGMLAICATLAALTFG